MTTATSSPAALAEMLPIGARDRRPTVVRVLKNAFVIGVFVDIRGVGERIKSGRSRSHGISVYQPRDFSGG
jgi:hypothetical protein